MPWLIEIDVDDVASGPLHGELCAVISDALATYAPGYATSVRVAWRVDHDLDATVDTLTQRLIQRGHGEYSEHRNLFMQMESSPESRAETLIHIAQADAAAAQQDAAVLQALLARREHDATTRKDS